METYRKVYCKDRMPDRSDDLTNLSVTVPAAWEFPAGEGTQIISSFYDFLHNEWVVNITEFHHPCKFAGYWLESVPTPEPPAAGPTIQGEELLISLVPDKKMGGYTIQSKDFPEAISEGDDIAEACNNLAEAITIMKDVVQEQESKGDEVKGVTDIAQELRYEMQAINYAIEKHGGMSGLDLKNLWNSLSDIVTKLDVLQPTPGQGEWTPSELKRAFQEIIWPFYNKALDNETGVGDVSDVIDRLVATAEEYASQPPANKKGK